jgi:hypothetical protein
MQQKEVMTLTKPLLFKYTLYSFIFSIIVLFVVILPAEYNLDLTGIGHALGLTVFNKVEVNKVNSISLQSSKEISDKKNWATETIEIVVPALSGVEYKFTMQEHQKLIYQWKTNGSSLYFDLHGEPAGDTTGYFESYAIATLNAMEGSFTTPFSGVHGWYWKNNSNIPVILQLTIKGEYAEHGVK